jgi:hypothetical protein
LRFLSRAQTGFWPFGGRRQAHSLFICRIGTPHECFEHIRYTKSLGCCSTKGISAVPVLDNNGVPIGMVSEGDLIRPDHAARDARREWLLEVLAEGEQLSPDFLAWLQAQKGTARAMMSALLSR